MGMDQNIYVCSKESKEKYLKYLELYRKNEKIRNECFKKLSEKYPDIKNCQTREQFEKLVQKDELDAFDRMIKETETDEPKDQNEEELMYWRKAWGLHWWIIENCGGNHDDDNCVRIYLKKEDIQAIIKELDPYVHMSILDFDVTNVEWVNYRPTHPFAKDDYLDYNRMYDTYKFFKELERDWDDSRSYYYWSWY